MDRLMAALFRGILHILLTFVIATVITFAVVEGVWYLVRSQFDPAGIVVGIVVGLIIGIIAGFIDLLIELFRGVEKGVQDVESTVGQVIKSGIDDVTQHHDQGGH